MHNNSNPYSLRLQLISLAKDLLTDEYHTKKEYALEQWRLSVEMSRQDSSLTVKAPVLPPYPTEEDILEKASALNAFVSKSK